MKLADPLRLNDWKIRDFLLVVLAVQLTVVVTTGLSLLGIDIPLLRQIAGFVSLAFIPGITLLRAFKMHNLNRAETVLFSVGLSIAFSMLIGLFMNIIYPSIGISNPISTLYLTLTLSSAVLVLCVLSYVRDRDFSNPHVLDIKDVFSPSALALFLLPLLSVLGTYFMNYRDDNTVLILLLGIISVIPILAMFDRFPKKLYPATIFVIALSLLYYNSLISTYLTGWDIQTEYYFANLVKSNSYWASSIHNDYNAMLSIVMLAPTLSNICNVSLVWTFKLLYPLLFSLVPVGLYVVFQKQTDERSAFLSSFLFMAIFTFYSEMLGLARQQIAEIFQVLLMLLIVESNLSTTKKTALGIIFAFSLVASHYGLSYIFVFSLLVVWIILMWKKWQAAERGIVNSPTFVLLCLIFTFGWYIYVSGSSIFTHVVIIGNHIVSNIYDFLNPSAVEGLGVILTGSSSPLHQITKYMYYVVILLISIGILALVLKRTQTKLRREYSLFSVLNFAICLAGLTVPYFAGALNTSRIFQIALLFIAPFFVIGAASVLRISCKAIKRSWDNKQTFLKILAVFLAIFFLFDSGLVYEIAQSDPTSISLNSSIDYTRFTEQEVIAAQWLKDRINSSIPVYSDTYRVVLLSGIYVGEHHFFVGEQEITISIQNKTYFFLGGKSVKNGTILLITPDGKSLSVQQLQNMTFYYTLLSSNKIYDNGGAQAYFYQYDRMTNLTNIYGEPQR